MSDFGQNLAVFVVKWVLILIFGDFVLAYCKYVINFAIENE